MAELQQAQDAAQSVLRHQAGAYLARGRESAVANDWEAAVAAFASTHAISRCVWCIGLS